MRDMRDLPGRQIVTPAPWPPYDAICTRCGDDLLPRDVQLCGDQTLCRECAEGWITEDEAEAAIERGIP